MNVMAQFGLFDDQVLPELTSDEPLTWASFANSIAKVSSQFEIPLTSPMHSIFQGKGFNDAHDYFIKTYGETEGKAYLQKLQGFTVQ